MSMLLLLIGAFLLGTGITGKVISQSCCFGPECPAEYLCDAAEPHLEEPSPTMPSVLSGIVLIAGGVLGLYSAKRIHH
jgi:hypothetical protein